MPELKPIMKNKISKIKDLYRVGFQMAFEQPRVKALASEELLAAIMNELYTKLCKDIDSDPMIYKPHSVKTFEGAVMNATRSEEMFDIIRSIVESMKVK